MLATRKLAAGAVEAALGGLTVLVREKDGFINATRLCKDGGKHLPHWLRGESAQEFVEVRTYRCLKIHGRTY